MKVVMPIAQYGGLKDRLARYVTGFSLVALGGWMLLRLWDGTLSYYLHPRFNILAGITGLFLVQLGGWLLWRNPGRVTVRFRRAELLSGLALISLLALTGLLLTPQPINNNLRIASNGSSTNSGSANRAMTEALSRQDWQNASSLDTVRWSLLDWSAALNDSQRAEKLQGRPVDVTGFVIRPTSHNFLLGRYVVVCCTADSTALRMPVTAQLSQELEEGQWVRVRGKLGFSSNNVPAFVADGVEVVARPAQPYIYP